MCYSIWINKSMVLKYLNVVISRQFCCSPLSFAKPNTVIL